MRYLIVIFSLLSFSIGGCELIQKPPVEDDEFDTPLSLDLDESMIAWYESLARINFVAVIPARSDIEIGEIYLTWDQRRAQKAQERLQRMVKRQRWSGSIVPEEVAAEQKELDLVDLPFVAIGSGENSDLAEIVPSNIVSDQGTFRMRPTAGRIDSQPLNDILTWLQDDDASDIGAIRLKEKYWRNLDAMSMDGAQPIWLHVVNEILYMQSMDIELSGELDLDIPEDVEATITDDEDESFGAEDGDRDDTSQSMQEQGAVRAEADEDDKVTVEDDDVTVTQKTNAFTRALAINEVLEVQDLENNVGIRTKLVYIDDDDVVVRTTLPRPVAIGVRGLRLQVNPLTGDVLRVQSWQP